MCVFANYMRDSVYACGADGAAAVRTRAVGRDLGVGVAQLKRVVEQRVA